MLYQTFLDGVTGINLCRYFSLTGQAWFAFNPETRVETVLWLVGDEACLEEYQL